ESAAERETYMPERRALLLRRLGDVRRERLDDAEGAIKSYEAALSVDAAEAGALAGLRALLGDEHHRGAAVRALHWTYTVAGDWAADLELTEHRLTTADTDADRVAVFKESAELAETRAGDAKAA